MTPAEIDAMLGKFGELKTKLCDCPDDKCAEDVSKELETWIKAHGAQRIQSAKLSDAQTKQAQATMGEINKCTKRLMNMSGGEGG